MWPSSSSGKTIRAIGLGSDFWALKPVNLTVMLRLHSGSGNLKVLGIMPAFPLWALNLDSQTKSSWQLNSFYSHKSTWSILISLYISKVRWYFVQGCKIWIYWRLLQWFLPFTSQIVLFMKILYFPHVYASFTLINPWQFCYAITLEAMLWNSSQISKNENAQDTQWTHVPWIRELGCVLV